MRRYDGGVLVGEPDPPLDFEKWLRGEVSAAEAMSTIIPGSTDTAVAWAVKHKMRAVLRAWENRA